jgi:hypothetical protein
MPETKTATASTKSTSTPWKAFDPCCVVGYVPIAAFLKKSVVAQNRLQRQDYNGLRKGTDLALFIRSFLPSVVVLVYSNGNGL